MKYYTEENKKYKDYFNTRYNPKQAEKIIKKLSRHFKLNLAYYFNNYSWGRAGLNKKYIILPKDNISLGLICHEVAHCLPYKRNKKFHTKRFARVSKKVYNYARKFLNPDPLTHERIKDKKLERIEKKYKLKHNYPRCSGCNLRTSSYIDLGNKFHAYCLIETFKQMVEFMFGIKI